MGMRCVCTAECMLMLVEGLRYKVVIQHASVHSPVALEHHPIQVDQWDLGHPGNMRHTLIIMHTLLGQEVGN